MVGRRTSSSHAARPIVIVGEEADRHIDAHRFDDVLVIYVEVLQSVTAHIVIVLTIFIWLRLLKQLEETTITLSANKFITNSLHAEKILLLFMPSVRMLIKVYSFSFILMKEGNQIFSGASKHPV